MFYPARNQSRFTRPRSLNRRHSITADVELPQQAEGVLGCPGNVSQAVTRSMSRNTGCRCPPQLGRARTAACRLRRAADTSRHELRFEFDPTSPAQARPRPRDAGRFQLYVDGNLAGDMDVAYTTPFLFNPGALTCGSDPGSTVTDDYKTPFRFTGTLHTVTVDLSGELIQDPEAELKVHMARQ